MESSPVLASRSTVKDNHDLQTVFFCPFDGSLQVRQLALDEWFTRLDVKRPVADRDPNVIQSGAYNQTLENIFGIYRTYDTYPAAAIAAKSASE